MVEIGRAYLMIASIYNNIRELDRAFKYLMKVQEILGKEDSEPYLVAYAWSKLLEANIYMLQGDKDKAFKAVNEARELGTRIKHGDLIIEKAEELTRES
ncbi:MAG: hypothetical protein J7K21_00900 [Desulfurococcales archaeon]|nr:hypothetical protein [Desulfurococcales archaeon]